MTLEDMEWELRLMELRHGLRQKAEDRRLSKLVSWACVAFVAVAVLLRWGL